MTVSLCRPALLIAALVAGLGTAHAQTSAQTRAASPRFFFGDSLSDTGNAYRVIGQPPVFNSPASSLGGRYSNGLMWVDHLAAPSYAFYGPTLIGTPFPAGTVDVNFAVGGSQSCGLPDCKGVSGSQALATGTAPGALIQINDYLSNVKAGRLQGPTATSQYFIFTGGNDYTPFAAGAGANATPSNQAALVRSVLGNISSGIKLLADAGARQIVVFNQFDLSLVPQFRDPALSAGLASNVAQVALELTNLHNAQVGASLRASAAATGANIVLIDVNALYRDLFKNPGVWGMSNATGTCVGGDFTTVTGLCNTATAAAQLMFWQNTHPSGATHAHIAALVNGTLNTVATAATAIGVTPRLALQAAESRHSMVFDRLDDLYSRPRSLFLDAAVAQGSRRTDSDTSRTGYDYRNRLTTLGTGLLLGKDTLVGAKLVFGSVDATMAGGAGAVDGNALGLYGYAARRQDRLTVLGEVGSMRLHQDDIRRNSGFTPFPVAHASARAQVFSLAASVAYALPIGASEVMPLVGLRHDRVRVGAYQESGTRLLDLAVQAQRDSRSVAEVGVRWNSRVPVGGLTLVPRLEGKLQRRLGDEGFDVVATLDGGQAAGARVHGSARDARLVKAGVTALMAGGLRLDASFNARRSQDSDDEKLTAVNLSLPF